MEKTAIAPKKSVHLKQFHDHGNHYCFSTVDADNMPRDHLPAGRYKLRVVPDGSGGLKLLFEKADMYILPVTRFGDHTKNFQRIRSDYQPDGDSMGVLLVGVKGTGKTLMAEELGSWMIGQGRPVIEIADDIPLAVLERALAMVGPCMMYFDEFGKNYAEAEDRNKLITLFSDNSIRGTLFVVTGNSGESEIPDTLMYRPGRFKYMITFHTVDRKTAMEVIEHFHVPEEYHRALLWYTEGRSVNLDVFLHVVRAVRTLRPGESIDDLMSILNVPYAVKPLLRVTGVVQPGVPAPEGGIRVSGSTWDGATAQVRLRASEQHPDGLELNFDLPDQIHDLGWNPHTTRTKFVDGFVVEYAILANSDKKGMEGGYESDVHLSNGRGMGVYRNVWDNAPPAQAVLSAKHLAAPTL